MLQSVTAISSSPSLQDLPAQLRQLADRIERGEVLADRIAVVADHPDGELILYGYGAAYGREMLALLTLAQHWLLNRIVDGRAD